MNRTGKVTLAFALAAALGISWAVHSRIGRRGTSSFPQNLPPTALANFELFDAEGHGHELYRMADKRAVVIFSQFVSCPGVQKGAAALAELEKQFSPRAVQFLGIDPVEGDSRDEILEEAKAYGMTWPILRDPSQQVAKQLGFVSTAEVVVIDTSTWTIAYKGPIDDRLEFGMSKGATRNSYLKDALTALLAGRKVEKSGLRARGCAITYRQDPESVMYTGEAGRIIRDRCVSCHSEAGDTKPYFTGYESLTSWAAMIRQTVMTGKMPIWGIDSDPGEFKNDNSLRPEEKRRLVEWLDANMPRGEGKDPIAGFAPKVSRNPDPGATFVAEMKEEAVVPPEGFMEYNYYDIGQVPRDMWVSAVEAFSSNPKAMHHATLNVTPYPLSHYQGLADRMARNPEEAKEAPGSKIWMGRAMKFEEKQLQVTNAPLPKNSPYAKHELIRFSVYSTYGRNNKRILSKNTARFLPKDYYLILETHHHGTGKPEKEKTNVYFYETKRTPATKALRRFDQIGSEVEVPPYARNFRYDLPTYSVAGDLTLTACNAHMHIRGRELHAWAELPDGAKKRILTVPAFDYTWHSAAQMFFEKPVFLPAGSRILSYAVIDNSATNPYNPDPGASIAFGETLDKHEMPKLQCVFYDGR